jgi:phosphoesterase RecJ-like protein
MTMRELTPKSGTVADAAAVLVERAGPYLVATHRNPDGDAIGSLLAVSRALRAQGRDVVMWHPDVPAVPDNLTFLLGPDERIVAELPADRAERTLVAVDCATAHRLADEPPGALGAFVLNIDHHHDNGRYGDLNIVAEASSTAEIILAILTEARWHIDRPIAEALHVGIVTDTGRMSYSNVTPDTLRADARLLEAGVDVADMARRLYENTPAAEARLSGRALAEMRELLDGRLIVSIVGPDDFAAAGTDETDGIAEQLRGIRGAEVGVLVRPFPDGRIRASLRAASNRVDVSTIARAVGGGGHAAAAGLTTAATPDAFVEWLVAQVKAQLDG